MYKSIHALLNSLHSLLTQSFNLYSSYKYNAPKDWAKSSGTTFFGVFFYDMHKEDMAQKDNHSPKKKCKTLKAV